MSLPKVGTKDHLIEACDIFTRTKQPFVILVLDGDTYSFRMGHNGPESIEVMQHLLVDQVLPYMDNFLQ